MSKKYVIEIEDEPITKDSVELWKACGFNALVFDQNGLDKLTPYETARRLTYENGLNDAWEAVGLFVNGNGYSNKKCLDAIHMVSFSRCQPMKPSPS